MSYLQEMKIYGLLLLLGLLSWGLVQMHSAIESKLSVADNSPDFFSLGYYKLKLDADGQPATELVADKMEHYSKDGATHLQKPFMTLYKSGQAPWLIKSETAIMAGDGDNVQLNGKAFISRAAFANKSAISIDSADLWVKLSTHYAETRADTEIISPPNKTTGTGMEVFFASPIHLKLLSKVKGRYELNK